MKMKAKLIVNPVSGTDAAPNYLQTINQSLRQKFHDLDIVMTTGAGDATQAAARAVEQGCSYLFIAGGDGTLNEVLNGVMRLEGAATKITFGLIPLGTGNDFAVALGLPEDVPAALDILLAGRTIEVDVGQLNDRFFVNVSAGGFIAEVSDAVNPQLKSLAGKLAYLVGGAQVLFDYDPVETSVQLIEEARSFALTMQMFAVCNSRLVGGGRLIAPDARTDDGLLDVCFIEAMSTLDFIGLLTRVSKGDHVEDERVHYFKARELRMEFARAVKVNTDGEVFETRECRYRVLPKAARFIAGEAPYSTASAGD